MALTNDPYVVADAVYNLFVANQVALGLADVVFGDDAMPARTPTLVIEPGRVSVSRAGAMNKMHNDFTTFLLLYHSPIKAKAASIRELMQFTQAIRNVYEASIVTRLLGDPHAMPTQQLLNDGYVTTIEPGFTIRQNSLVRTARITLFGMSETMLN